MKSATRYYWGLALVCVIILAAWLIGLQAIGGWLWGLVHGLSRV
jgi:hypothetical protein